MTAVGRAARRLRDFLDVEAASGALLVVAAVAGITWANSPWAASYADLWHAEISFSAGRIHFDETLGHVVNDLLMAVFFLVVGMEIKRELVVGNLRDRRAAALPIAAAAGGMIVPALIYATITAGGSASGGWGIPMATDIAFAAGVVALLGARVPSQLKLFLLALAIVDDIGAIAVIAIFYSDSLDLGWLAAAAATAAVVAVGLRSGLVRHRAGQTVLVAGAVVLWVATYESGVHATIAGVVLGLIMPANRRSTTPPHHTKGRSLCDDLIHTLHPWSSYLIVPVFALANAGVEITAAQFREPGAATVGVAVGLVVGKLVGVTVFSWLAVRVGIARLPRGVGWSQLAGIGAIAGIGFTVALFITDLAFADEQLVADAKVGTLIASAVAAALGVAVLVVTARRAGRRTTTAA